MVKEVDIESAACQRILEELHILSIKINPFGQNGWPDRIFLLPAQRVIFIEFKRPGKDAEKTQPIIHRRIRHHGHKVEVHDTVQGAFDAVRAAALAATQLPKGGSKVPSGARKRRAAV